MPKLGTTAPATLTGNFKQWVVRFMGNTPSLTRQLERDQAYPELYAVPDWQDATSSSWNGRKTSART
jgi:hypothetical protein